MRHIIVMSILAIAACGSPTAQHGGETADSPARGNIAAPPPPMSAAEDRNIANTPADTTTASGTDNDLPDRLTSMPENRGAIDPKSAEGAGQVVQRYGAYLEGRQFVRARALWGSGGAASNQNEEQFVAAFADRATIHSEVGKPYDSEGAAGSIFIQVPFHLFGKTKAGARYDLVGPLTLRRVNDVDGATPEQLKWHIVESALEPKG